MKSELYVYNMMGGAHTHAMANTVAFVVYRNKQIYIDNESQSYLTVGIQQAAMKDANHLPPLIIR